ncbi:hypothetical protein LTR29_006023 [Friedmanniomyces endolithicus]|nr:hypothetical protein LTR29_006023 [Friedmanniomyces endolithicus]
MADSARSKNDAIMLKAIRELDAHTAELRERRSDPAAVSDAVNGHIDSALEALVAPLNSRRYPFLLEADDQAEYRDTAMTTDPPSPDEDDEDEEDDDDEDDDDEDDEELTGSNHAEYVFMVGKTAIYAWEYLGKEWSEWINSLHSGETPYGPPKGLLTQLREWQLTGMNGLIKLAECSYHGAILGDEMGLGKKLTAICACEHLKSYSGAYNLIVTSKARVKQWRDELCWNFKPEHRPRVLILNDPKMSVSEILDQGAEYVICTYQFAQSRWRAYRRVIDAFESLKTGTKSEAMARGIKERRIFESRQPASLHSDVYRQLGRPIRCMILDEGHLVKNEESATYDSLKNIHARFVFVLTDALLESRWMDAFGPVSFLKNHPFDTRAKFCKAFSRGDLGIANAEPSRSKENRLVKFLQGVVIARPASVLKLDGLVMHEVEFAIADPALVMVVVYVMKLFYDALGNVATPAAATSKSGPRKAVLWATLAQQLVANYSMLSEKEKKCVDKLKKKAVVYMDEYLHAHPGVDTSKRAFYDDLLLHLNKFYNSDRKSLTQSGNESLDDGGNVQEAMEDSDSEAEHGDPEDSDDDDHDTKKKMVVVPDDDDPPELEDYEMGPSSAEARADFTSRLQDLGDDELISPRINALIKTLQTISRLHPGEKVLVFSRFLKFLDIAARALDEHYPPIMHIERLDGTVDGPARKAVQSEFVEYPEGMVLLITAGCGGTGLDLTAASHVVQCEPWWREADELQAYARAFRVGQEKEVHVWKLFGENAVVDGALRALSARKAETNDRMKNLCRPDGQAFVIPRQFKWGSGGV